MAAGSDLHDVVARAAAGDREAWGEIFALYEASVRLWLRRFSRSGDQIEDWSQGFFLQLFGAEGRKLGQFRPQAGASFEAWLYVGARRYALGELRTMVRREKLARTMTLSAELDPPDPRVHDPIKRLELQELIDSLPPRERCVGLAALEGYSYREIAKRCGVTPGNAGVILCRLRRRGQ